jgi:uncharacterized membrane protein YagU involved in acid resistance
LSVANVRELLQAVMPLQQLSRVQARRLVVKISLIDPVHPESLTSALRARAQREIEHCPIRALTLLPILHGDPLDWSYSRGSALFGSLVGHIIYGLLLGLMYAVLDRLWTGFFTESDPINREVEGPGTTTLRSLGWGAAASLGGSLLFSLVMIATGVLPRVAHLVGGSSPVFGFLVHLIIGVLIGMSYGVLFHHEAPNVGAGVAWGLVYGLAWWFIGHLTLLPILLGGTFTWTTEAAEAGCRR